MNQSISKLLEGIGHDAEHLDDDADAEHLRMAVRLRKLARHALTLARRQSDTPTTGEHLLDTIPEFAKGLKKWEK